MPVSKKDLRLSFEKLMEKIKKLAENTKTTREETQALGVRLDRQQQRIRSLQSELDDPQNTLMAREVGIAAEQAAIKYIFPKCTTKLYRIRSFHALEVFLKDPEGAVEKTDLCGESAAKNYRVLLSEEDRVEINHRFLRVKQNFPTLRDSILDLKDCALTAYLPCANFQELLAFYQDEEDTCIALLECKSVMDSLATNQGNPTTESDQYG